jgi:23S rRNA pseudouridine955/2504/2580 synthase
MTDAPKLAPLTVTEAQSGLRLDKLLGKLYPHIPFGQVKQLCRKGQIRLDGKRVKGDETVAGGQQVRLPPLFFKAAPPPDETPRVVPNPRERAILKQAVLFEDDSILVLNKPAGIPVQAGSGHTRSLDRLLAAMYKPNAPKLTHRLDLGTSGVLLLAKDAATASRLTRAFGDREMEKVYWAVSVGQLYDSEGVIDFSLSKKGAPGRERVTIDDDGDEAETHWKRLAHRQSYSWLELRPKTGRTHQIRAHLSALGAPLLGDFKYGDDDAGNGPNGKEKNLFLHARSLSFMHPHTGKKITVTAPAPDHFARLFDTLKWKLPA